MTTVAKPTRHVKVQAPVFAPEVERAIPMPQWEPARERELVPAHTTRTTEREQTNRR